MYIVFCIEYYKWGIKQMNEPKSIIMKISVQNFKASLGKFEVLTINFLSWTPLYILLSVIQRDANANVYVYVKKFRTKGSLI